MPVTMDPLAIAQADDLPTPGVPAGPPPDIGGGFAGLPKIDASQQAQAPAAPPVQAQNPFAALPKTDVPSGVDSHQDQTQGTASPPATTATAAGSDVSAGGPGAPVPASSAGPGATNPFAALPKSDAGVDAVNAIAPPDSSGLNNASSNPDDWTDLQRQVVGLPPKNTPINWEKMATGAYQATKQIAKGMIADVSNALQIAVAAQADADANNPLTGATPTSDKTLNIGQQFSPDEIKSGQRGTALIVSTAVPELKLVQGGALTATITAKILSFAATRAASGVATGLVYGAVAPNDPGQDTWDNMKTSAEQFAWQVPLLGAVFHGLGWGTAKVVRATGLPRLVAEALSRSGLTSRDLTLAASNINKTLEQVKQEGANPQDIPEAWKIDLVAMNIHNAADRVEPNNLDHRVADYEAALNDTKGQTETAPRLASASGPPEVTGLTPPRDVNLPDPVPGSNQMRIAQGVYQNPDGTVEAYGYRGVSKKAVGFTPEGAPITRAPTDPGLMDAIYMSPSAGHATGFGDLHYIGAKFSNPLIIDDWHLPLPTDALEQTAQLTNDQIASRGGKNAAGQDVSFLVNRHPGVIAAARLLGHDGIIVRSGLEGTEVVALHPDRVFSAGAAEHIAANEAPDILTPAQKLIESKALKRQNGVRDIGTTDLPIAPSDVNDPQAQQNLLKLIDNHTSALFGLPQQAVDLGTGEPHSGPLNPQLAEHAELMEGTRLVREGLWRVNGRVFKLENVETPARPGSFRSMMVSVPKITDVTGISGIDPTIHPDVQKAILVHDGVSKANSEADMKQLLGDTQKKVARTLAGFEPNPVGFGKLSKADKMVAKVSGAVADAADGHIDDALLQLTAPREVDLKVPKQGKPVGVHSVFQPDPNAIFPAEPTARPPFPIEQLRGPRERVEPVVDRVKTPITDLSEVAPDGRIRAETVDEHLRNAQQLHSFDDTEAAAQRVKWAFDKDPDEAAKRIKDFPNLADRAPTEVREVNKATLTPQEEAQLANIRARQSEMREPFRIAMAQRDRPESVRLANLGKSLRDEMDAIYERARQRTWGPDVDAGKEPKEPVHAVGEISVSPALEERPPWAPTAPGTSVPQVSDQWAMLNRMTSEAQKAVADEVELPGVVKKPKSLRSGFAGNSGPGSIPLGAINRMLMFRIASGGSSVVLGYTANNTSNPKTRALLYTAAGVMGYLALKPEAGGTFDKSKLGEALAKMNDLPAFMKSTVGDGAAGAFRDITDLMNYWVGTSNIKHRMLLKEFPTPATREMAARVLDNPNNLAALSQLTERQKQIVGDEAIFNLQTGEMLKTKGVLDRFREDYLRHLWPQETYDAYRSAKGSLNPGGFTKPRAFNTLDDAEAWAKENNLKGPIVDIAHLQVKHMLEVGRAIVNKQMVDEMTNLGLIMDKEPNNPAGWVTPRVQGMGDKIAPAAVATALERLGNFRPGILDNEFLKGLDTVKSWQMRMVMAFPWIHGLNIARGALALDGTGASYIRAYQALHQGDPSIVRALNAGVRLYERPDFADMHAKGMEALLQRVGEKASPILRDNIFGPGAAAFRKGEDALWNQWVPSLGLAAYNREMMLFTDRSGGRFVEGSPEFKAASSRAADFANTVMGKSLDTMKDPGLTYMLRNIFFAPQWMASRMRITGAALGELRGAATGTATAPMQYLPYKVRSLAIGAAFTYAMSKLLTGKEPTFNPNNDKFYAHTGVVDSNHRELGFDTAGWWADDIKMFGDPAKYFMNRLSPMIQATHTLISGRDAFGRSIGGLELADELAGEFGPASAILDVAGRAILKHGGVSGADAWKGVVSSSEIGSVASIPRQLDMVAAGLSYKLLHKFNLPTDSDRIYELQQIITSNIKQGKPIVDDMVVTWLAMQKRSYKRQFPKPAAARYLWQEIQNSIRTMGNAENPTKPVELAPQDSVPQ